MPFCRFCFDMKIDGPHDHFLRSSKEPSAKTVCPRLLNIECQLCHNKGHTKQYCPQKNDININININRENIGLVSLKKSAGVDKDGFTFTLFGNKKNILHSIDIVNSMIAHNTTTATAEYYKRPDGMSWADWNELVDA